jgi:hypothetical protein
MPSTTVSTTGFQAEGWVLTNLEYDTGTQTLEISDGYSEGTATSPWYVNANWAGGYGAFSAGGSVGQGCVIRFQFRMQDSVVQTPTEWSPWYDIWADGVTMADNLDTLIANAGLTASNSIQFSIYMRAE